MRAGLLFLATLVAAHNAHEGGTTKDADYAVRHMATEHHIDSFDLDSFFQLHDLNRDGVWDRDEIEAIYGVHHVYSQRKSKDEIDHQKKADYIVSTVLSILDKNNDGTISMTEFAAKGLEGLPSFEDIGAEGHHYDIESEFFLHHEEQYHSTPETQTDEAYSHPEDLEHFEHHEAIEQREYEREARYQGISVDEAVRAHEVPPPSDDGHRPQEPMVASSPRPRVTRPVPPEKQDPEVKYRNIEREAAEKAEWGAGEDGYKAPQSAAERLRRNMPYKYKFRRNWGDF